MFIKSEVDLNSLDTHIIDYVNQKVNQFTWELTKNIETQWPNIPLPKNEFTDPEVKIYGHWESGLSFFHFCINLLQNFSNSLALIVVVESRGILDTTPKNLLFDVGDQHSQPPSLEPMKIVSSISTLVERNVSSASWAVLKFIINN